MNHSDTLRGAASRAAPFFTANIPAVDLSDAADYIDLLEIEIVRLRLENNRLKETIVERNEQLAKINKKLNSTTVGNKDKPC